jgi:hypothetical protein
MGYRSDVNILVALPTKRAVEEVMAVYAMHEGVQRNDIAKQWTLHEDTYSQQGFDVPVYLLHYEDECVMWYDGDEDVEAVVYMRELLHSKADADEDFAYTCKFVRVGEEIEDIDVDLDWSDDANGVGSDLNDYVNEALDVHVSVSVRIPART